jgi:hypothetical protein
VQPSVSFGQLGREIANTPLWHVRPNDRIELPSTFSIAFDFATLPPFSSWADGHAILPVQFTDGQLLIDLAFALSLRRRHGTRDLMTSRGISTKTDSENRTVLAVVVCVRVCGAGVSVWCGERAPRVCV